MGNIWCVGQRFDALVTNSVVASSNDGINWTSITDIDPPFLSKDEATAIVWKDNVLVVGSTIGNVSISSDYSTWLRGEMGTSDVCINGMTASTSSFFASCMKHYTTSADGFSAGSEIGQIFRSGTGAPGSFNLVFSASDSPSILYNIKYFEGANIGDNLSSNVVIAVGEYTRNPYACYSTDNGATWAQLSVPEPFEGAFYDVEYNPSNDAWYFGAQGQVAIASNLTTPDWTTSISFGDTLASVFRLHLNPEGQMVAVTPGALWSTSDLTNWSSFSVRGYFWQSINWYNNQWIAGAQSIMTQYTFWTSSDSVTWVPYNNHIQPMSFSIAS